MANLPLFYLKYVEKKASIQTVLFENWRNHPNRLSSVSMTGTYTLTQDGRNRPSPPNGWIASVLVSTLDFSSFATLNRVYQTEGLPAANDDTPPNDNEFYLKHKPSMPWRFFLTGNEGGRFTRTLETNVGTTTHTRYIYNSGTGIWSFYDTQPSIDQIATLTVQIFDGGYEDKGGKDTAFPAGVVVDVGNLVPLFGTVNMTAERFPWDESWASITDFGSIMAARIATQNAAVGYALYSGTGSPSINFTF